MFWAVAQPPFPLCRHRIYEDLHSIGQSSLRLRLEGEELSSYHSVHQMGRAPDPCSRRPFSLDIPKPARLGKDEIIIDGTLVVNLTELLEGRANPPQARAVLSFRDGSTGVLALAANVSGHKRKFSEWIQQQSTDIDDLLFKLCIDVDQRAQIKFLALLFSLRTGSHDMTTLQTELRIAHKMNMVAFLESCKTQRETSDNAKRVSRVSEGVFSRSLHSSESLSWNREPPSRRKAYYGPDHHNPSSNQDSISYGDSWTSPAISGALQNILWTPGFQTTEDKLLGSCKICGASGVSPALLFRKPSTTPDAQQQTSSGCSLYECPISSKSAPV